MAKNEVLALDEKSHKYRLMPSGKIIPGVSEIIGSVFPYSGRGLASERAANFGTAIHKAIELEIQGKLNPTTVDEALQPYLNQFWKFLLSFQLLKTQCKLETILFSRKYGFAGRLDIVEKAVIDIKTGHKMATHRYQIAAYRHLWQINYKEKKKGLIVYLDGTDKEPEVVIEQPSDFAVFLACLEIFNAKKKENIK